jgi:chemotaxis family two-component system sensor histidine kinase/response regulator PixL
MSLSPEIRDQAYQFFIEEAAELLHIIEMGLLDLRNERSTAKIHEVMRAAHSIKGGGGQCGIGYHQNDRPSSGKHFQSTL